MLVGQRDRARHRPDSVTNTLALERAPWRARAHRRIVDAVAGMDLVQRHPLLRLKVLRWVGRNTGIRADG